MIDLSIATFNVNRVRDDVKRSNLFQWLKQTSYDIIALQEFNCPTDQTNKWLAEWARGGYFSQHCAILLNNTRLPQIKQSLTLANGRLIFIDLMVDDVEIRFANIYVPSSPPQRAAFMRNFPIQELKHDNLILAGDFNSYANDQTDRSPPLPLVTDENTHHRPRNNTQWPAVERVLAHLSLLDPVPDLVEGETPSAHRFTFSMPRTDKHTKDQWTLYTRIDHIFLTAPLLDNSSLPNTRRCPAIKSDHRILHCRLSASGPNTLGEKTRIMDIRLLKDPEYHQMVCKTWTELTESRAIHPNEKASEFWDRAKAQLLDVTMDFGAVLRKKQIQQRHKLASKIARVEERILANPYDTARVEELDRLQADSIALEQSLLERTATLARVKWIEQGEKPSPFFTHVLRQQSRRKTIKAMRKSDGSLTTTPEEAKGIVYDFWKAIYTSQGTDLDARRTLLSGVKESVTEEHKQFLDGDLIPSEVEKAIIEASNGRSLGDDGIPNEFYKTFMNHFSGILTQVFNEATKDEHDLPNSHKHSLITLLYKKGDRTEAKNYRPISLTNCDYKIFTKILTTCTNKVATYLLGDWQTGFIPGRNGHDNVYQLHLVMQQEYKKITEDQMLLYNRYVGQNTCRPGHFPLQHSSAFLSIDQEKAYDRVEWEYLHAVLVKFGFGPRYRKWIKRCYTNLSSRLIINGKLADSFSVSRGLRQGDPLAPLLFNFVIEPFLLYYATHAKGIKTPDGWSLVSAFADDTNLTVVRGDEQHVRVAIELHQRASGAKVNDDKTVLIPLQPWTNYFIDMPEYTWETYNKPFTHLGISLSATGFDMNRIETEILANLRATSATWRLRGLTLQGRVSVLNSYFLSKLWHCAPFYPFRQKFFMSLERVMKDILWKGKRSRVNFGWMYKSKTKGGWGLLHPPSQIAALKAKFVARFLTETPKWADVFEQCVEYTLPKKIVATPDGPGQHARSRTMHFILQPSKIAKSASYLAVQTRKADASVHQAMYAWSQLNISQVDGEDPDTNPKRGLQFGRADDEDKDPLEIFTVKLARKAIFSNSVDPSRRNIKERTYNDPDISPWPWNEKTWKRVWRRVHHCTCRTKESQLLFLLAHRRIITNSLRKHFLDSDTDGSCRRCTTQRSHDNKDPIQESVAHAFAECQDVMVFWNFVVKIILELHPKSNITWFTLKRDAHERILGWPSTNLDPYPLIQHIHSAAIWAIYVTFCQLGDGENVESGSLESIFYQNIRRRAQDDWIGACQQDKAYNARPIRSGSDIQDPDKHCENFKLIWNHPPHIEAQDSGPSFGPLLFLPQPIPELPP